MHNDNYDYDSLTELQRLEFHTRLMRLKLVVSQAKTLFALRASDNEVLKAKQKSDKQLIVAIFVSAILGVIYDSIFTTSFLSKEGVGLVCLAFLVYAVHLQGQIDRIADRIADKNRLIQACRFEAELLSGYYLTDDRIKLLIGEDANDEPISEDRISEQRNQIRKGLFRKVQQIGATEEFVWQL